MKSTFEQPVFLLGFGGVGRALARQIVASRDSLARRRGLKLNVIGAADSQGVAHAAQGLDDDALMRLVALKEKGGRLAPGALPILPTNCIVVDTTATDATVPVLLDVLRAGGGVALANKLPLAGKMEWFDAITAGHARWETTVGAAMPVIQTLSYLLDSGDEVLRIEGCLSGTLGFIAAQLEAGVPFGAAVRDAKQHGYTEPDPRQDLGGRDAARKALILARMLGYRLNLSDVHVESLYPAEMDALTVDAFLREVDGLNARMAQRAAELTRGGRKLRYAAVIEDGKCRVELTGVEPASKLGSIRTSDSIVVFTTKHYQDNPLAISGRGAGQEVTASGVLGDVVSLASEMR
ncbi:MAG: homoserine dehydrogenase [Anaerolineae bacterium]